jgi:GTP-binding protein
MLDFLADVGVPTIVVATKTDKLGAVAMAERLAALTQTLGLDADQLVPFSSRTGEGRSTLAVALNDLLAQPSWRVEDAVAEPDLDAELGGELGGEADSNENAET